MAKLSVTVAVIFTLLLFFLTLSQARVPSHLQEDEAIGRELPHSRPDSDVSSVLRLPSNSVNDESHSTGPAGDIPQAESISVRSIPLRLVRFRPMNRHFPIRSSFPFRNCRHHHHRDHPLFKSIRQQEQEQQPKQHVEIRYGNDMILSTFEINEFDPLMFHHGRLRRIPAKWVKFHLHHHDDDHEEEKEEEEDDGFSKSVLKHSHRFGKEKFKMHLHDHHKDRDHEEEEENQVGKKRERKRAEEGSFLKRIRKFLDQF